MGYNVGNADEGYYFNCRSLHRLLKLAHLFRWQPEGKAVFPKHEQQAFVRNLEWELVFADLFRDRGRGPYFTNDGFVVTQSDAAALAGALVKVLESHDQDDVKRVIDFSLDREDDLGPEYGFDVFLEDPERRKLPVVLLRRLIRLCRNGAFSID